MSHRWPQFLPDGRHFLFFSRSTREENEGVYFGAIDRPGSALLVRSSVGAAYSRAGQLLYVAEGTLMARNLDIARGQLTGEPLAVVENVGQ